jgi:hypothetical protein
MRYTAAMRAVVASLFVAALLLGPVPAGSSPPDDIAAYCRAQHPQIPFQVRCLNVENAAAARVGRVGPGPDPEGWTRCRATTPSWSAMEQCMAESARAAAARGDAGAAAGAAGATGPTERPPTAGVPRPDGGGAPSAPPPVATTPPAPATPPPPAVPGSSTVILGPQATPTSPAERDRQTRPISEADADRQLRSVLERNPSAKCTKKQYGPGWVISCE